MMDKVILIDKKNIPALEKNFIGINKMEIKNKDNLLVGVLFHGGCKEHFFKLFGFFEDNEILNLILEHDSNGDPCKRVERKNLLFDLSPVRNNDLIKEIIKDNFLILKLINREIKYYLM
jgi:hypothetical protein